MNSYVIEFYFDGIDGWENYEVIISQFEKHEILYNNLKPADNSVRFYMVPTYALMNKMRTASQDVPVRIYKNSTPYFYGYLRNNFTFTKQQRMQPIAVEVVSVTNKLKKKIKETFNLINVKVSDPANTANSLLHILLDSAGIPEDRIIAPSINHVIPVLSIEEGERSYHEVISQLMFEYGYTFDFDPQGYFITYELFPSDLTSTGTFDGTNCLNEIKQYKKELVKDVIKVKWKELELLNNVIVFSDVTNAGSGNKCNIPVAPNSYFGPSEDVSEWFAEYNIEGTEIVAVLNGSLDIVKHSDIAVETFTPGYKRALIKIKNTNTVLERFITKFDIKGDAYVIKADSYSEIYNSAEKESIEEVETRFIFQKEVADNLVKGLDWFYRYSDFSYELQSKTNHPLGAIVTITETGLGTINARIIEKKVNEETGSIRYRLDGVSEYVPLSVTSITGTKKPGAGDITLNLVNIVDQGLNDDGTLKVPIDSNKFLANITPSGDGLYLTKSFIGLFKDGQRKSYIDIDGTFEFKADNENYIKYEESILKVKGLITATSGEIGGWIIDNLLKSAQGGARIELNPGKNRVSIFDSIAEKVVIGYLEGLPKRDGSGNWGAGDYGFWAKDGDKLRIDGDAEYVDGDWLISNDASFIIKDGTTPILRLGTAAYKKGLFINETNTGSDYRVKLTTNEFFVGNDESHLAYDAATSELIFQLVSFKVSSLETKIKGVLVVSDQGTIDDLIDPVSITTDSGSAVFSHPAQISFTCKASLNNGVEMGGGIRINNSAATGNNYPLSFKGEASNLTSGFLYSGTAGVGFADNNPYDELIWMRPDNNTITFYCNRINSGHIGADGVLTWNYMTRRLFGAGYTYNNVAHYYSGNTGVGTIAIIISNCPNIMLDGEITTYGYVGSVTVRFKGYTYTGTSSWYVPQAEVHGTAGLATNNFLVRAATRTSDGARVLFLGTTSTQWGGYLHVSVNRVTVGYGHTLGIGTWSIALLTSESGYTITHTAGLGVMGAVFN